VKLCRYAPLEHPLVQQFQRAIDSLTAGLSPASVRQYRAVARCFLIYLGEQHPAIDSLNQLRRDPHILGWFGRLKPFVLASGSLRIHSARTSCVASNCVMSSSNARSRWILVQ
jgi:hypothetical protein